jgi:hypothetical protein
MPTVYTTDPTAAVRIGAYGVATKTVGVQVPEAVALELESYTHPRRPGLLLIIRDEPVARNRTPKTHPLDRAAAGPPRSNDRWPTICSETTSSPSTKR